MKYKIFTSIALLGGVLVELFGGWDRALQTLMIFMAVDILQTRAEVKVNE